MRIMRSKFELFPLMACVLSIGCIIGALIVIMLIKNSSTPSKLAKGDLQSIGWEDIEGTYQKSIKKKDSRPHPDIPWKVKEVIEKLKAKGRQ